MHIQQSMIWTNEQIVTQNQKITRRMDSKNRIKLRILKGPYYDKYLLKKAKKVMLCHSSLSMFAGVEEEKTRGRSVNRKKTTENKKTKQKQNVKNLSRNEKLQSTESNIFPFFKSRCLASFGKT